MVCLVSYRIVILLYFYINHKKCFRKLQIIFCRIINIMSLTYIGQQCTIYGGFCLLFVGIISNGMNIIIFSSVDNYRTIPLSFYFLVGSICKSFYVLIILTTRILAAGFVIDLTHTSIVWCKMRQYLISTFTLICLTCSSLAIIDQFLMTTKSAFFRRCSNIKWAHRIVFIMIIVWSLHGIPFFLYFNISPISKICVNTDAIYRDYLVTYALVTLCYSSINTDCIWMFDLSKYAPYNSSCSTAC